MRNAWQIVLVIGVICWFIVEGCDRDSQCQRFEVCCGNYCKTWPECFINTDKECFYNTHCVKGKTCMKNVCVRDSTSIRCSTQEDCLSTDTSLDCCQGLCLPSINCTKTLETSSSTALKKLNIPVLVSSCKNLCSTGFVCVNRTCTLLNTSTRRTLVTTREVKDHSRDPLTTGFISAALFSGAVLILFVGFCLLKKTKYCRKFCYESPERTTETLPTVCPRHQRTALSDCHRLMVVPQGLTVYPNQPPPTYDEAINNYGNTKCLML